jgi:hypothetical protein
VTRCDRDDDNDACADVYEPGLNLNPFDAWDFYSVPVPALFVALDPLGTGKSRVLSAGGPQAIFAYFKAGAKTGTLVYDADFNSNGVQDGTEYDRSIAGPSPWQVGPPDGIVSAGDAQKAFAQFKLAYKC